MTALGRLIPTVSSTPILRSAVLGVAGLAFAGGVVAGPATTAHATQAQPAGVTQQAGKTGGKELPVRYQAQPNFFYCGPAAVRNTLTTQGHELSQDELARQMGTTEAGTNSAHDITKALNKVTGEGTYRTVELSTPEADTGQTDKLATDIKTAVDAGRGVVVNIAGTATDTDGGSHSFPGGHYISAVGYTDDGKTVTIADSAAPDNPTYQMDIETLADWAATRGYSA